MWNRRTVNSGAGTVVVQVALPASAVRMTRALLTMSATGSVDVQTTGGASLSGGPIALSAGVPWIVGYANLDDARNNPLFNSGLGLGMQLVIAGGTATGYVDYSIAAG
jgi:hypothetical protein